MVTLTADKDELVITVRLKHAPLASVAKAQCPGDAKAAEQWLVQEACAAARMELDRAGQAAQLSDAQIDTEKVRRTTELDAIKHARANVTGVADLVKPEAKP